LNIRLAERQQWIGHAEHPKVAVSDRPFSGSVFLSRLQTAKEFSARLEDRVKELHFPAEFGRTKNKVFLHMPVSRVSSEEMPVGDGFLSRPIADKKGAYQRGQSWN
jgi:hypothetical protein